MLNDQSINKLEEHQDIPSNPNNNGVSFFLLTEIFFLDKKYIDNGLIKPAYIDKLLLQGNEVGLPQMSSKYCCKESNMLHYF